MKQWGTGVRNKEYNLGYDNNCGYTPSGQHKSIGERQGTLSTGKLEPFAEGRLGYAEQARRYGLVPPGAGHRLGNQQLRSLRETGEPVEGGKDAFP